MKLSFYAKKDHVVHWPGPKMTGQRHDYVGRRFEKVGDDAAAKASGVVGVHGAQPDAGSIDSESPDAAHLIRACRKGGLWAADEATAQACGVDFVKLTYDKSEREWLPANAAKKPSAQPQSAPSAE